MSFRFQIFIIIFAASIALTGCGAEVPHEDMPPPKIEESQNSFPYSTREPESFSAKAVIVSAGQMERIEIARMGDAAVISRYAGTPRHFTLISGERTFIIFHAKKIYAEVERQTADVFVSDELTSLLLAKKEYAVHESLGAADGLSRYRVKARKNVNSEALVTIDDKTNLPVRYELFSITPEGTDSRFILELSDIELDVTEAAFQIPNGYSRVNRSVIIDQIADNE